MLRKKPLLKAQEMRLWVPRPRASNFSEKKGCYQKLVSLTPLFFKGLTAVTDCSQPP